MMTIRTATMQDLDSIAAVEKVCFRSAEAATREELEKRLQNYPDHFWLMTCIPTPPCTGRTGHGR